MQGAVVFEGTTSIRKLLARKDELKLFRWRIMRAQPKNSLYYCSGGKNGNKPGFIRVAVERGTCPMSREEQGQHGKVCEQERHRNAINLAKEGKFDEIDADIYLRSFNTLRKINHEAKAKPKETKVIGMFLFGDSRTGKSRFARSWAREIGCSFYVKDWTKWWDGYNGEDVVIMEECNDFIGDTRANDLKRWIDRYSIDVQVKGAYVTIRPKAFIITSNYPFTECFTKSNDRQALRERLKIIYFKNSPTDRVPMDCDDSLYAGNLWDAGQRFGNENIEEDELPFNFDDVLNPVRRQVAVPAPIVNNSIVVPETNDNTRDVNNNLIDLTHVDDSFEFDF